MATMLPCAARSSVVAPLLCAFLLTQATAAEHKVSSGADIARLSPELQPGDVLIMKEGEWKDQSIAFQAKGTAEKPITLRAETPGKVLLVGESSLLIDGEYLVVSGVHLKNAKLKGDGIKLAGSHNRLTESAATDGAFKFLVHIFGVSNRMDHCYLAVAAIK